MFKIKWIQGEEDPPGHILSPHPTLVVSFICLAPRTLGCGSGTRGSDQSSEVEMLCDLEEVTYPTWSSVFSPPMCAGCLKRGLRPLSAPTSLPLSPPCSVSPPRLCRWLFSKSGTPFLPPVAPVTFQNSTQLTPPGKPFWLRSAPSDLDAPTSGLGALLVTVRLEEAFLWVMLAGPARDTTETLVPLPHTAPADAEKMGCSLENNLPVWPSLEWEAVEMAPTKHACPRCPFFPAPPSLYPCRSFTYIPPSRLCPCSPSCLPSLPSTNPDGLTNPGPRQAQLLHRSFWESPAVEAWLPDGTAVGFQLPLHAL